MLISMSCLVLSAVFYAQTEWNKTAKIQGRGGNPPLNETGLAQAQGLAEKLKGYTFAKIYASTRERAMQTAKAVHACVHLSVCGLLHRSHLEWGHTVFGYSLFIAYIRFLRAAGSKTSEDFECRWWLSEKQNTRAAYLLLPKVSGATTEKVAL